MAMAINPYAPPASAPLRAAQPTSPRRWRVLGVISITLGVIGLVVGLSQGGLFGLAYAAAELSRGFGRDAELPYMMQICSGFGLQGLILTLFSALLVIIGVGQRRRRAWAPRWAVRWSLTALMALAVIVALCFLYLGPGYGAMHAHNPSMLLELPGLSATAVYGVSFALCYVLLLAPYPILTLVLLRLRLRTEPPSAHLPSHREAQQAT